MGSIIRALDVDRPRWLRRFNDYLPRHGVLSPVCMRTPIYLVSSSLMDRVCPPEARCYDPLFAEEAARALDVVERRLTELVRDLREPWQLLLILERAERIIEQVADEAASRARRVECTVFACLGCYVRHPPPLEGVEPGPAIFVDVERLEQVAEDVEPLTASLRVYGVLHEGLLRLVVAHESVHALCDVGPSDSPSRRLRQTLHGRVVEESLATYYGLRYSGLHDSDRRAVEYLVAAKQPLEYRAFWAWKHLDERQVDSYLLAWAKLDGLTPLNRGLHALLEPLSVAWLSTWLLRPYAPLLMAALRSWPTPTPTHSLAFWKLVSLRLMASAMRM